MAPPKGARGGRATSARRSASGQPPLAARMAAARLAVEQTKQEQEKRQTLERQVRAQAASKESAKRARKRAEVESKQQEDSEEDSELVFEDDFEDEYESEHSVVEGETEADDDQGAATDGMQINADVSEASKGKTQVSEHSRVVTKVYTHNRDRLQDGEELVYDPSAYEMIHQFQVEWPALSFEFLPSLAENDHPPPVPATSALAYPLTVSLVMGTQAVESSLNELVVLRLSRLRKTRRRRVRRRDMSDEQEDEDDDSSENSTSGSDMDDDDDDEDGDALGPSRKPVIEYQKVKHKGCVNRLRVMPQKCAVVASWSDVGNVYINDLSSRYEVLNRAQGKDIRMSMPNAVKAVKSKTQAVILDHQAEGYALDWSPNVAGCAASGDVTGAILQWNLLPDGTVAEQPAKYSGHQEGTSVEDIQWSPSESTVFASCGVDRSICFFDIRQQQRDKAALVLPNSHKSDVNVLSWNARENHLLLSGGDDGMLCVWDLRAAKSGDAAPVARLEYHTSPITAVCWHPSEPSMLAASSEDNSVSIWDLSVERDPEEELRLAGGMRNKDLVASAIDIPPQLLFVHLGQTDVKEIRWHPVYTSILGSSALNFNVLRVADIF